LKNYTVRLYNDTDFDLWNDFITKAKNATFLFHRDFMEYHKDRFDDYSMMVFCNDKLVSVIPANRVEDKVYSHQGLTYGGFVLDEEDSLIDTTDIFKVVLNFLTFHEIVEFQIKELPFFYNSLQSSIEKEIITNENISIVRKHTILGIDFKSNFSISKSKLKHYRRLSDSGLKIIKDDGFESFWSHILIPLLSEKYRVNPVHSLAEITYLKSKFEDNIEQYNLYLKDEILAGITIFKTSNVIKSQYGAVSEIGKKHRALDFLFIYLIEKFKHTYSFFDMGTVDNDSEKGINEGLLNQKIELGCKVYHQNVLQIIL
jgi:hypothetical protein